MDHIHSLSSHNHTFSGTTAAAVETIDIDTTNGVQVADNSHTHTYSGNSSGNSVGSLGAANPPYQVFNFIVKY